MKKLEDIPKKGIYEAPEGYFDRLPGIVQARIASETPATEAKPYFRYTLQYALPALVLLVVTLILLRPNATPSTEDLLATIPTEELVSYLEESDLSTEELIEGIEFDEETIKAIEEEVYVDLPLDDLMNEEGFDLDNL